MLKAGIIIDAWKLPVFEKHLSNAGYVYEQSPGVTPDTLTLTVNTLSPKELGIVVQAASDEASRGTLQ